MIGFLCTSENDLLLVPTSHRLIHFLILGLLLWCLWLSNQNVHRRLLRVAQAVSTGRARKKASQTGALGLLDELFAGYGNGFFRFHVIALT